MGHNGTVLIAYDVETVEQRSHQNPYPSLCLKVFGQRNPPAGLAEEFLLAASDLHTEMACPATFFISGLTADENRDTIREISQSPFVEIACHGHRHRALKGSSAMSWDETEDDTRAAIAALAAAGVRPTGFTAPYNYSHGILDSPGLQDLLLKGNFHYVRTWGRDAGGGTNLTFEVQPFFYCNGLLEIPINWDFDVQWRMHNSGFLRGVDFNNNRFLGCLEEVVLDQVAGRGRVWSTGFHDWTMMAADPNLRSVRHIMDIGAEAGVEFLRHDEFCARMRARVGIE
jgi:hypothetical protein